MEKVAESDAVGDGDVAGFDVDGTEVLVARVDGDLYAIGDECTHQRCMLSDGWLEGQDVVCPCHSSKFDLETGEPDRPPATEPEPTFDVEERDGAIYVDL